MRFFLPLLLALCSVASGQTVTLPKEVRAAVGQPVTIHAETDGRIVRWKIIDSGLFSFDPNLQTTTKALQVLSITEGRYRVLAWTAKDDTPGEAVEVVVIVSKTPGPGPGPKPPDPPNPPQPDNLTDTAKKVRDWAKAVGNPAEAKQIAENYGAIISAIAAGAYKELAFTDARAKIVSDVLALNKKVSDGNPKWAAFSQSLTDHTKALDAEGKLDSVDKIKALFEDIQAGLEAAL